MSAVSVRRPTHESSSSTSRQSTTASNRARPTAKSTASSYQTTARRSPDARSASPRASFGAEADNLAATTTQLVAAALFVAPVILIADTGGKTRIASADSPHVIAAVATGLLGSAVPFLAFNRAIRDLTVARAD